MAGREPFYLSWGHKAGRNNSTESAAYEMLRQVWCDPTVELLFHHAKFDMAVATERWGLPPLPWNRTHDTMFESYLDNPHGRSIKLKDLAHDLLGWPPEEQDRVARWVQEHKAELEGCYPEFGKVQKGKEGKWIFAAPAELVEPYAIGDVARTEALHMFLLPSICERGMGAAYDRERQLLPILMDNERLGMRVDLERLESDLVSYTKAFEFAESELRRVLKSSGLNFDADQDVAAVLIEQGVIPESNFARTEATRQYPNGQYSMSKKLLLPEHFTGPMGAEVASVLGYRNRLKTCLDTFMRPWAEQARVFGGRITTNWNQTRGVEAGGTRTGRPSTNNHNFLNISKAFAGRDDQYVHPAFLIGLPELPLCRIYVLPDEGEVMLHRDFSGQEMRVFGHFEQGDLWRQYQANPRLDVHDFVGAELKRVADREIERTKIKVMNFQALYGGGAPALQRELRCSLAEAKELKSFHERGLPGRKILVDEIKKVVRRQEPIITWGGREYYCEPPGADGRSKDYKLINYIIQGSAADLTKQAIIDWHADDRKHCRFMVTVYDEINASSPKDIAVQQMAVLRENMETPRISVQLLSDGKWGLAWGSLAKYKDDNPGEVPWK